LHDNEWQGWIGRSETAADTAHFAAAAALAATLDHADMPQPGSALPPLWHWLYFLPRARHSEIGSDGHPRRGGFMPPVPLPRRMWAGSRFEFRSPLHIGDNLQRRSTIESVRDTTGRSGRLVFVRVRHEVHRDNEAAAALLEWHDIVYRQAVVAGEVPPPPSAAPAVAAWTHELVPDPVLLFRYSALTFNGHRIHYDRPYAVHEEGYPGLVVHGPLIATLLIELLRRERPDAELADFRFKALRPSFDGRPLRVCGEPSVDGRSVRLWAADSDGWLAMDASATLR
jgi:3-methylfumaryl-CoA hydratase